MLNINESSGLYLQQVLYWCQNGET